MLFVYRALFHMHPERRHKCLFLDIVRPITHPSYMNHESYRGQQFFFSTFKPTFNISKTLHLHEDSFCRKWLGAQAKKQKNI